MADELRGFKTEDVTRLSRVVRDFEAGSDRSPRLADEPRVIPDPSPIVCILLADLPSMGTVNAALLKLHTTTDIQDVKLVGDINGGTFNIVLDVGAIDGTGSGDESTSNISVGATSQQMQTALESLSIIEAGDVVADAFTGRWLIKFTGQFKQKFPGVTIPLMRISEAGLLTGGSGLHNGVVSAFTTLIDSGETRIVRSVWPVGKTTPMVAGAQVVAIAIPDLGYTVISVEPRDFFFFGY